MKSSKIYLPLLLFACIAMGVVIGGFLNFPIDKVSFAKSNYKTKLNKLIDFIDNEYIDNVKTDSIVDLTVNSILGKLDPHSVYITPKEQTAVAESMKGNFVGIGVNFYNYKDSIVVIKPVENSPAEKAGIVAGDRILYANNYQLFGKKLETYSLFNKLRGEINSEVSLTIFRKSTNKTFKINLKRNTIPIKSVSIALMLNKNLGYIKINRFAETTFAEFHAGLLDLKLKGMQSLIIDLRENGGGFLEMATQIADDLLKNNALIVVTKNKKGTEQKTFATEKGDFENGKLTVLVDENSASASEILAGAIQDNDRGIIIGRRSFGKGLVQREMNFEDGSAVRLTIARYYTPSGRSIQKPYKKGESETYFKESETRFESGELYQRNKIKVADSLKFKTKSGRIVYGGGGIVPDVFVPLETIRGSENLAYILQSGVVSHFVFEILDTNKYNFNALNYANFNSKAALFDFEIDFQNHLKKNGLQLNLSQSKSLVNRYIKAEFVRQLFGETKYFEQILAADPMIKKVMEN